MPISNACQLAAVEIAAQLLGLAATVVATLAGWSYWVLVIKALATFAAMMLMAFAIGLYWGIEGVAAAVSIKALVVRVPRSSTATGRHRCVCLNCWATSGGRWQARPWPAARPSWRTQRCWRNSRWQSSSWSQHSSCVQATSLPTSCFPVGAAGFAVCLYR